jgi:hypothetical protein
VSWKNILKLEPPADSKWRMPHHKKVWEGEEWQPKEIDVKGTWWVSRYTEVQNYGGPEEGGWWYYNYEYTGDSVGPFSKEWAVNVRDDLQTGRKPETVHWEGWPEEDDQMWSGMLGATRASYIIEEEKGSNEDTRPQHYE